MNKGNGVTTCRGCAGPLTSERAKTREECARCEAVAFADAARRARQARQLGDVPGQLDLFGAPVRSKRDALREG